MTEPASSPANRKYTILKIAVTLAVVGGLLALFRFLPVAAWIESFKVWVAAQGLLGVVAYGLAYVGVSLVPGGPAAVMTLAGGAVFGFVKGTILVSLSSLQDPGAIQRAAQERKGDPVKLLAKETQAGKVVTGSYYLQGERLQFQSQVQEGKTFGTTA